MEKKVLIDLDNPQTYRQYDPDDMLVHIRNFPELCEQAWQMAQGFQLPEEYQQIKKIVILGMGGSAIGGDLIAGLAVNESAVQITVCRDYILPRYVDKDTLVIASSYSGMTEETLSAFEQACKTPAKKLAITTGGKLKSLCESRSIPVFTFGYKSSPRAALPYSFFLLLGLLQNLKVFQDKAVEVAAAIKDLHATASKINEKVPSKSNTAKALASRLNGRLPVIYGAGITGPAAQRWKTQINENSKTMAFYEVFSELNHNAIMGYQLPEPVKQSMVVMLDSELLHERIRLRYEITQKLLEQAGIPYQVIKTEGNTALSQMMGLVFVGDYVSYYLAMLNGVDPTHIRSIDFLKNSLAES
jgi:glucose/mannose-6-phosphate isomerase